MMVINSDFVVFVRCITFNHSAYIRDCLEGFCMQETDFPYVCAIVDDASTDGEQEIIKAYLQENFNMNDSSVARHEETEDYNLVYAQHKINKNCFFAVYFLKYNHYSIRKPKLKYLEEWLTIKYGALCEGDDYWCSPHKLQRQLDFLESHPHHTLCFHAHYALNNQGIKKKHFQYNRDVDTCPIKDIILGGGGFMATNSMLYIRALGDDWRVWAKSSDVGDGPLMRTLAARGKVGYINEIMSCYRVATDGSWTQRILLDKKKNKEHHKNILLTWKEYDEWTEYKYHKYIKRAIRKNILTYWLKKYPITSLFVTKIKKMKRKWN